MTTAFDLWVETCLTYWLGISVLYLLDPYPIHLITPEERNSRSPIISVVNQLFVNGAIASKLSSFPESMHGDFVSDIPKIPIYFMISSGLFYYIHRGFHTISFLKRFHRHHHHWIMVKPMDTFDCHPIEQLFLNVFPILFPAWFLNISFMTFRIILHFSICSSLLAHLDYRDSWLTNQFHKLHHLKSTVNFGQGTTFFDRLHGTFFKYSQ